METPGLIINARCILMFPKLPNVCQRDNFMPEVKGEVRQ